MAVELTCPCGRRLRVADGFAGRVVRCPKCSASVTVPVEDKSRFDAVDEGPPKNDDDEVEHRRRRRARDRRLALNRVRFGISLALVGVLLQILGALAVFALAMIVFNKHRVLERELPAMKGDGEQRAVALASIERMARMTRIVQSLVVLVPTALGVVATILCLMVPETSGVRGLAFWALATYCVAVILASLKLVGAWSALPASLYSIVLNTFTGVSWLLFMLYLKGLAGYLHERAVAGDADPVLYLGSITWVGLTLGSWIATVIVQILGCLGILLVLGLFVAWVVYGIRFLMRYITFLSDMRAVLAAP
jgi:hypothetical protein